MYAATLLISGSQLLRNFSARNAAAMLSTPGSYLLRNFSAARISKPSLLFSEADLIEQFVRGSGAGGQSVARTANCVVLKHVPTGIVLRCHATRSRDLNRKGARKELQLRLDDIARGSCSVRGQKTARKVKKKAKARSRAKAKYGSKAPTLAHASLMRLIGVKLPLLPAMRAVVKLRQVWPFKPRSPLSPFLRHFSPPRQGLEKLFRDPER